MYSCGQAGEFPVKFDPSNEIKGFVSGRHEISMTGSSAASISASCAVLLSRGSCPADPFSQICLKGLPGKCPPSTALASTVHHCIGSSVAADGSQEQICVTNPFLSVHH